ncbi:selenium-dependent molybdenum cofactor biosynthesis protein YqeB [Eubacterium multiforme]|uniref:Xanthine dehydrogenase accessory factor n=1 Tax=Eubacterium multiforme TaxID=83339 RepID=A0ABT9USX3_9FIRM|nr:selenium-dependent molybdenum cofactor biosynthesis protein YqeB [Eubacterium multiforme]MDQ0149428.1 xanthine dehydrogenase accessory factor [Eubacterium multiforme]
MREIIVVRGAGDIATGAIQKLYRSGFKVVAIEIKKPSSIRRKVCLSEAIYEKEFKVEDVTAKRADSYDEIFQILDEDKVCILNDEKGDIISKIKPMAVVDATLCKKNIGTNRSMADITVALGPGYIAGKDVDIVIETNRGHDLGRIIFNGPAQKNTGIPGIIQGYGKERVVYSEYDGNLEIIKDIGSIVEKGENICKVSGNYIKATLTGVIRGMIRNGYYVKKGLKIADIDPRIEQKRNCDLISDKARCIGGATLESILILKNRGKR